MEFERLASRQRVDKYFNAQLDEMEKEEAHMFTEAKEYQREQADELFPPTEDEPNMKGWSPLEVLRFRMEQKESEQKKKVALKVTMTTEEQIE